MRKSARTQIPPFFDNDPYSLYIQFIFNTTRLPVHVLFISYFIYILQYFVYDMNIVDYFVYDMNIVDYFVYDMNIVEIVRHEPSGFLKYYGGA